MNDDEILYILFIGRWHRADNSANKRAWSGRQTDLSN